MWANIAKFFIKYIGLPLLIEAGQAITRWVISIFKRKENENNNQQQSENYVNSENKTESGSNFGSLP